MQSIGRRIIRWDYKRCELYGQGISQVTIWVDGNLLTTLSSPPYQAWWTLSAGEHRFWAEGVNANGETMKSEIVTITVLNE